MRFSVRSKLSILFSFLTIAAVVAGFAVSGAIRSNATRAHAAAPVRIDCSQGAAICAEVYDSEDVFGNNVYVGHDEPSTLFYSNVPGSGNRMRYVLTLPKDPTPGPGGVPLPGQTFNFELHPAFWFGMAMCDTQSYPQQVSTCTPDSDSNIVDPTTSPNHPGSAFMEMQFYPPGFTFFPTENGLSCDPTKWCAALNIDSLSEDPVAGTTLNTTCQGQILGGVEYINFAFITRSGHSQGPANPKDSVLSPTSLVPSSATDLFMNSGDQIVVTMHDTPNGLKIVLQDKTSGQSGSMTASAANGFGQIQEAPPPSTACNVIPYNFHPMYSTSSEKTRVIWAAHSYNIAFADEIGHFDYCNGTVSGSFPFGCSGTEGAGGNTEPTDGDDFFCSPASASLRIQVSGCTFTNGGFDGVPYQTNAWPDGTSLHPTPIQFTSPKTGSGYNVKYSRMAFEGDQPRVENNDISSSPNPCNRNTGVNCTIIPNTDDGNPASFYPFFSTTKVGAGGSDPCVWQIGNHIPGSTNDFSQDNQYGQLLSLTYLAFGGGGAVTARYNDFRQILSKNPC